MLNDANSILVRLRALLNTDLHGYEQLRLSEANDYYKEVCTEVAGIISAAAETDCISIYATGLEPGYFSKVAQIGNFPEEEHFLTNSASVHFIHKIQALSQSRFSDLKRQGACEIIDQNSVVFYLFGRGEIFGFIIVRRLNDTAAAKDFFMEFSHEINAIIADQAFSHRMNTISEALLPPTKTKDFLEPFGEHVAELITRGFGADGSTFRIFSDNELKVIGKAGHVSNQIIAARQSGEQLSGLLFDAEDEDWAAIILSEDDEWSIGGISVPQDVKQQLRENGLYSVLMCKLHGLNSNGQVENYGTLSYYFLRTTAYSRRDVSLFKSFADRVSAYLAMHFSFTELQQQKNIIELQSRIMTFSEVANLLAHDIWHKSNALTHDSEELDGLIRRSIDRGRLNGKEHLLNQLENKSDKMAFSANALQETTGKYKKLQQADSAEIYKKTSFILSDALDEVERTLRSALDRRKVDIRRRNISSRAIYGPRFLFEQVLYNLSINAIDSISGAGSKNRGGWIEISSHVEVDKHIVRFTDSGPGIEYSEFPNINSVFDIGKTTKGKGSGTGLTIARQLIGSHFSGELQVTSRRPATFTIVVPG